MVVLDSSALLSVSFGEPGADRVLQLIETSRLSAVSLAEVVGKLLDRGISRDRALAGIAESGVSVITFDALQGEIAGLMRAPTRKFGLSLGDRCCLALGRASGARVLTADRAWADLDVGVEIEVIR